MWTLDPDYLPRTGFWEGVVQDLTSRGALAGAIAAFYSGVTLAWWVGHVHLIRRRASRIPIRILVTGTRGKSSVVRLLHGALRAAGYRVAAKTTGTAARILEPDGTEKPTLRLGAVSILETVGSLSSALREGANALVSECMAVNPVLIGQLSSDVVRPTIVDITNAELDHLEEEGTDRRAIMRSLSTSVYGKQIVVTSERDSMAIWDLQQRCLETGSPLIVADQGASQGRSGELLLPDAHPDNVALALATTRACGVPDSIALSGMKSASHEPQENEIGESSFAGVRVRYCNLGSINDADNVFPAVQRVLGDRVEGVPRIALLCGRSDRPLRALLFAGLIPPEFFDAVAITGGPEAMVKRELLSAGWSGERVLALGAAAYSVALAMRRLNHMLRKVDSAVTEYELVALENVHVQLAARLRRRFIQGNPA